MTTSLRAWARRHREILLDLLCATAAGVGLAALLALLASYPYPR